jgi:hypothetical protein
MTKRHEIKFKSYDRFFPNQDTMPKGGFGNLIALPLQKAARKNDNSVFIDERFHPYEDQWEFLAQIRRLSEDEIGALISKLCHGNELGELKQDDEEPAKPWEMARSKPHGMVSRTWRSWSKPICSTSPNQELPQGPFTHLSRLCRTPVYAYSSEPTSIRSLPSSTKKIVWYGSINLLSYGSAQESIMRLESPNIAQELMKDLGKSISP